MPRIHPTHLVTLSATVSFAALAAAEPVRWINPQGGSFDAPANWSPARVPLPTDTAVFDLNATYTVTLASSRSIQDCTTSVGEVTLDLGTHELTTQSITCVSGSADITNGDVHGRAVSSGGKMSVLASAEFDRGGSASNGGQLIISGIVGKLGDNAGLFTINSGAMARVEAAGAIVSRTLTVNGTLEVDAGQINAEVLMVSGDLAVDDGTVQCETNPLFFPGSQASLSNGTTLTAPQGAEVMGDMLLEGAGTSVAVKVVKGWLRLESGAEAHANNTQMSAAEQGRVEIGPGGTLNGVFYRTDFGTLRLEPGSTGPTGGLDSYGFFTDTRLEIVVDAIGSPRFDVRGFRPLATPFQCEFAGTLAIEVENPNALRIGDAIPLFNAPSPVIGGNFSSVLVPLLPGSRELGVSISPTQVLLRVGAGGPDPCWSADFNGDGNTGTDEDIMSFFACLAGHCCPTCGEGDFNTDGDFGTDQDIEAFFRILAGGAC